MARIVLGVTGGIAAYKSVAVARGLIQAGHSVHVVPTPASLQMVGVATWQGITGAPAHTSVFDDPSEHVHLGRDADLLVIAPATAHTLARLAHGLADDLLTNVALMATCPVLVAPAMHTQMWLHPATQANVAALRARGVAVVGPGDGPLAGGDTGPGRMSEPEAIVAAALGLLHPQDLAGWRVVVTAGGTREPIDPVRFLGNRSSGRQGAALARAASQRGAQVTLIAANVDGAVLGGVPAQRVTSAAELAQAVTAAAPEADVVVMAAAVADYRVADAAAHKLKKQDHLTLELTRNPDILAGLVAARRPGQRIVGFAAETGDAQASALEYAATKARAKGADLLVFNEVGVDKGFGDVPNAVTLLDAAGRVLGQAAGSKDQVAHAVWDQLVRM